MVVTGNSQFLLNLFVHSCVLYVSKIDRRVVVFFLILYENFFQMFRLQKHNSIGVIASLYILSLVCASVIYFSIILCCFILALLCYGC